MILPFRVKKFWRHNKLLNIYHTWHIYMFIIHNEAETFVRQLDFIHCVFVQVLTLLLPRSSFFLFFLFLFELWLFYVEYQELKSTWTLWRLLFYFSWKLYTYIYIYIYRYIYTKQLLNACYWHISVRVIHCTQKHCENITKAQNHGLNYWNEIGFIAVGFDDLSLTEDASIKD